MTPKQKRFCDEYLIDCNATQSAIRAGYSENSAYSAGQRMLKNVEVKNYIEEQLEKLHSAKIADAQEVLEYLTSVLRGESQSTEIVIEGCGDGVSEARTIKKEPSEKDRLKAGELLGKRFGMWNDKMNVNLNLPVFYEGEDSLED